MSEVNSPIKADTRKGLDMRSGDTVRVWQKIIEKDGKTRLQAFEGMVIARKHGTEIGATFTVRRNTGGFGVEKIFPLYSPMIDRIEVIKRSKIRRSKLYYIRDKALKQAKKRFKMMFVDFTTEEKEEDKPETEEVKAEGEVSTEENTESDDTAEIKEDVVEEIKEEPTEEVKEEEKKGE